MLQQQLIIQVKRSAESSHRRQLEVRGPPQAGQSPMSNQERCQAPKQAETCINRGVYASLASSTIAAKITYIHRTSIVIPQSQKHHRNPSQPHTINHSSWIPPKNHHYKSFSQFLGNQEEPNQKRRLNLGARSESNQKTLCCLQRLFLVARERPKQVL